MARTPKVQVFPGRTSTHGDRAFVRYIAANGRAVKGAESPHGYSTMSNARRAARKLYPGVAVETLKAA